MVLDVDDTSVACLVDVNLFHSSLEFRVLGCRIGQVQDFGIWVVHVSSR